MVPVERTLVLDPDDDLVAALDRLTESRLGRALVVDDGPLAGLLSMTDVASALQTPGRRRSPLVRGARPEPAPERIRPRQRKDARA